MIPSHLLDPTKKKNERLSRTVLGVAPPPPLPSLCVTGAMSRIGKYRVATGTSSSANEDQDIGIRNDNGNDGKKLMCPAKKYTIHDNGGVPIILSYIIFRPRQLYDQNKPPLLCLHGGPSIPSNYLLPIVNGVTDRTVIFYDQWGCGKSSRPQALTEPNSNNKNNAKKKAEYPPFSIPTMVEHLRQLIDEHWKLKRFHLFGHSFGGILAYEYLLAKTCTLDEELSGGRHASCVSSLLLSSTPTSASLIQSESERLFRSLTSQEKSNGCSIDGGNGCCEKDITDKTAIASSEQQKQQLRQSMMKSEEFQQTHECRLADCPLALMDALGNMGPAPWRGIEAIHGYEAEEVDEFHRIPSLLLRGEYDFCTESCMAGWRERLDGDNFKSEEVVLSNCSHYAMLEDENQFGAEILRFIRSHDAEDWP
ncbi:unnamed protein product [Pseudo-nitzschia multistriata]|uniref:AB hydrolase-1 domain-containing protein n=1 Tax=Pseudo-nitzschia multistriata TaxID=183589 RepID=A0A448ZIH6_9STRA|nr:unnamed protein product [Pseudo-nitzschia multistriata]